MIEEKEWDIERLLQSVRMPPLPPGLRKRILEGATARRSERRLLPPFLRVCFVTSIFIFVMALAADAFISRREAIQARAFASPSLPDSTAEDPTLKEEIYSVFPKAAKISKGRYMPGEFRPHRQPRRASGPGKMRQIEEEIDGFEN